MSLAFLLGMFLCGLFRAGQLPQRLQGTREGGAGTACCMGMGGFLLCDQLALESNQS